MRLKKIELDGFKSFADKTEFSFDSPITVIVGPNGCGKSNIVDAVKWVLGEQSVKSLRSDRMSDVIFSGSSSRKSSGTAEVSLYMSNPEEPGTGRLPIDSEEIQVTRRIYKSGESEYSINNKPCRLRDIREMFMDTGIGAKAYSIIEQGQIEQVLNASSSDRRVIFEEAAGISKYKAHKKEALRRLERTEQNLLRLADILSEIQKQLRSVKLQAGKARNYLRYTDRLKELQVSYRLAEYNQLKLDSRQKRKHLDVLEDQLASVAAKLGREDSYLSELSRKITEKEHQLSRADNSMVEIQSRIEQKLQRIEFLQSRIKELQERQSTAQRRITELKEQKARLDGGLEKYREEQSDCELRGEKNDYQSRGIQQQLQEVTEQCASLAADLEDEKSGIIDIVRRTAQLHNELQSISSYRDSLSNQKQKLADRAEDARGALEGLFSEKAQNNARLEDIENVLEELQSNLDCKSKELEELVESIQEDRERGAQSKEARSALNSEFKILKDMEEKREGIGQAAKLLLEERSGHSGQFGYVEGVLAEKVSVDMEYAGAVEAALEGYSNALIATDSNKVLADKETIEKLDGRVNFLCLDKIEPFSDKADLTDYDGVKGRLVEFVDFEPRYAVLMWRLLGKVILVDSIDSAGQLAESLSSDYKFVTLAGGLLSKDGMIKLGPVGRRTGLISRKSRLQQLEATIKTITEQIAGTESSIGEKLQRNKHLEKRSKELRTAFYEANTEKIQVNSKLAALEQDIKRLREEQPLIDSEMDMLETQIKQSVQNEYNSKQKLEEMETVNEEHNAQIQELESQHAQKKQLRQKLSDKLTELKVSAGQITEQKRSAAQTIESLDNQIAANRESVVASQKEAELCSRQTVEAGRDILSCESDVSELYAQKDKGKEGTQSLNKEIEQMLAERQQAEGTLREKRMRHEDIEHQAGEVKIALSQIEVKEQDLVERVQEELEMDLAASYEDYEEEAVDWDKIREEINELRGKIERLGNVNLDAIDEQQELEDRNEFLTNQVEDLNTSKSQLKQLINRLNKKSREKFNQTFEEVRSNFQEIFRKLFGGGKADIVLEEADDILEAGIDIIAKPPGKETRSITLLSGGEKSMTAIALLFAIFRTKPSPFCFLDEIDAALDEANNERFNMLLEAFLKDSHFIIITHSKRTMSTGDILFGITMQHQGVSKKISVRFGDYDEAEEPAAVA